MGYNSVSIGTASTLIVAENCKRKVLSLVNYTSSGIVFIGPDANITIENALPLLEYSTRDSTKTFGYYLGPIYGIASAGTANVRYWESE
jgi:hypothetical protein